MKDTAQHRFDFIHNEVAHSGDTTQLNKLNKLLQTVSSWLREQDLHMSRSFSSKYFLLGQFSLANDRIVK